MAHMGVSGGPRSFKGLWHSISIKDSMRVGLINSHVCLYIDISMKASPNTIGNSLGRREDSYKGQQPTLPCTRS